MTRQQFIMIYAPVIQAAYKGTGLFVSVGIAQAIIESFKNANTLTDLAAVHNNFGGIKPDRKWNGDRCTLETHDGPGGSLLKQVFCSFKTPADFFNYKPQYLRENANYIKAGVFTSKTPQEQAEALQKAGYSQNAKYPELIMSVIQKNDLQKYDTESVNHIS